jgi:hypothetical protein
MCAIGSDAPASYTIKERLLARFYFLLDKRDLFKEGAIALEASWPVSVLSVILGSLDSLIPMIFDFAQKSFPTQYLLPFFRFERISLISPINPLFHPATILPSLSGPFDAGLEDPLKRLTSSKSLPFDHRAPWGGGRHRQTQSEEAVTPFSVITLKS